VGASIQWWRVSVEKVSSEPGMKTEQRSAVLPELLTSTVGVL